MAGPASPAPSVEPNSSGRLYGQLSVCLPDFPYFDTYTNCPDVGSHELKKDNAIRKSDHTVVLSNLDKVVTSPGYDEKSQMVGKRAFSIRFQEKFGE